MNILVLCVHVLLICSLTLGALRLGREAMVAWLSLLAIAMNLFVLKQINLFGLHVTASDALGVGYLLGLNLIQEYFGRDAARKTVWISLFTASAFLMLSHIHLLYIPNRFDHSHNHFTFLLTPMLRIVAASLFSFLMVQLVDIRFFTLLRNRTGGKYLSLRILITLLFSQILDTLLFSFLALYGNVLSIADIIFLSLAIKIIVIVLSTPFVTLSKKVVYHAAV